MKISTRELDLRLSDNYDDYGETEEHKLVAKRKVHQERTDREFVKPQIIRSKPSKQQDQR